MYEDISDGLKVKKSQRPHKCEWCGESILKGSSYIKRVYKWDGDLNSSAQHDECYIAMQSAKIDFFDGFQFGEFERGTSNSKL